MISKFVVTWFDSNFASIGSFGLFKKVCICKFGYGNGECQQGGGAINVTMHKKKLAFAIDSSMASSNKFLGTCVVLTINVKTISPN